MSFFLDTGTVRDDFQLSTVDGLELRFRVRVRGWVVVRVWVIAWVWIRVIVWVWVSMVLGSLYGYD